MPIQSISFGFEALVQDPPKTPGRRVEFPDVLRESEGQIKRGDTGSTYPQERGLEASGVTTGVQTYVMTVKVMAIEGPLEPP